MRMKDNTSNYILLHTICQRGKLWQVNVKIAGFMTEEFVQYMGRELQILHVRIG